MAWSGNSTTEIKLFVSQNTRTQNAVVQQLHSLPRWTLPSTNKWRVVFATTQIPSLPHAVSCQPLQLCMKYNTRTSCTSFYSQLSQGFVSQLIHIIPICHQVFQLKYPTHNYAVSMKTGFSFEIQESVKHFQGPKYAYIFGYLLTYQKY